MGDGGRDLLQKWYQLIQQASGQTGGSVVVSAAPWGSYMQGTYINCLNTILAPSSSDVSFQLTREGIDASVQLGRESGKPVVALVITTPDNPTGNYLEMDAIQGLVQHAVASGIEFVLLDFMYQSVTDPDVDLYDVNGLFNSLTDEERNAVFILDGLTKSVGGVTFVTAIWSLATSRSTCKTQRTCNPFSAPECSWRACGTRGLRARESHRSSVGEESG